MEMAAGKKVEGIANAKNYRKNLAKSIRPQS
jgi:hypothetical protein